MCVRVSVYGRIPLSPPLHSVRDNVAPGHTSRSLCFFLEIRIGASLHCRKKSTDRHDRNLKQNGSMKSDGRSSRNIISLRHTRALSLPLPDERTFGLEAFLSLLLLSNPRRRRPFQLSFFPFFFFLTKPPTTASASSISLSLPSFLSLSLKVALSSSPSKIGLLHCFHYTHVCVPAAAAALSVGLETGIGGRRREEEKARMHSVQQQQQRQRQLHDVKEEGEDEAVARYYIEMRITTTYVSMPVHC